MPSCSFEYRSLYFIKIKNSYADRSFVVVANARHPSPECDPLTSAVCPPHGRSAAGIWRAETAASGLYGGDVAPKCFYGMTYHNRVVLWHVRRGGTHLRGVVPLTDGAAAGT